MSEIKRIKSLNGQLKTKLKNIKTKYYTIKGTKVWGLNRRSPRAQLKGISKIETNGTIEMNLKDWDQLRVWLWNYKKIKIKVDLEKAKPLINTGYKNNTVGKKAGCIKERWSHFNVFKLKKIKRPNYVMWYYSLSSSLSHILGRLHFRLHFLFQTCHFLSFRWIIGLIMYGWKVWDV